MQFRDVQGVSDNVAYLMSIGDNTTDFRIYKTYDGGATWHLQFTNHLPRMRSTIAWPSGRRTAASRTATRSADEFPEFARYNGQKLAIDRIGACLRRCTGEASFSSSGTCIATQGDSNAWVTTGGSTVSRILATTDGGDTWNAYDTPLISNASAGGLSVAFRDGQHGIVGGGDLAVNYRIQVATSDDGGKNWTLTKKPPIGGAIFALAYASGSSIAATAKDSSDRPVVITSEDAPDFTSGAAAWTPDEGTTWYRIAGASGYWGLAFADPQHGWFVGNNGAILKISF